MEAKSVGFLLVAAGALLVVVGLLVTTGAFGWFGRLLGDLRFEGENTRVHVPIASMLIISVVLTLALNLLRRWF